MDRECMNVVYASNDGYARHLGTSLYSLLDRNRDFAEISVYVLTLGLSEENQGKLREIAEHFGRRLIFLNLDDLLERIGYEVDTGGFDISVMLRLFMGDMLPESVERVLYLDCDTVVLQSLKHLWKEELEGKIVGAVMEPTIYQAVKESIDLSEDDPYYNSGVLLVDLKQWREQEIQKKLYRELTYLGKTYKAVTPRELQIAKRHPSIIHYMGDERPWIAGNLNHYRRAYELYLAKTPWAGAPKQEGKRAYMLAYHMLDYATAICPPVRRLVSRKLGMKLVESRKKA